MYCIIYYLCTSFYSDAIKITRVGHVTVSSGKTDIFSERLPHVLPLSQLAGRQAGWVCQTVQVGGAMNHQVSTFTFPTSVAQH